jgi:hypothetical protein
MNYRIILSFILVLFSFPLTCFSGIGEGGSVYIKPPSTLPDLPPSLPQDEKKVDFFRKLPKDMEYKIYDCLNLEDLQAVGKVSKEHCIEKEYFKNINLIKEEASSTNIISILTKHKKLSTISNLRELPNSRINSIEIKGYKIDSHVLDFILKSFPNLSSLKLHNTDSLTDKDLENLSSSYPYLTSLILKDGKNSNKFTDNGLKSLGTLKHPTHLELGGNELNDFTNKGLEHLKALIHLTHLKLEGKEKNFFTDNGLKHLKSLKNLIYLELWGDENIFTDEGLEHIKTLMNLTFLKLDGDVMTFTDEGLEHLKALKNLIHLKLDGKDIAFTDKGLEHLKVLTHLTFLHLSGFYNNNFTDKGLEHLKALKNLIHLKLDGKDIAFTDKGLEHLAALPSLTSLTLGGFFHNEFTDKGLEYLAALTLLTYLKLDGYLRNIFTDNGLKHLKALKRLTYLHLRGNNNDFTVSGVEHFRTLECLILR